jgi:hypothetical protein
MSDAIERQLGELQRMTTTDLVDRYEELHGHACRTRHRAYLIRKIAWRIQANAEGDLSERAKRRAAELADDAEIRTMAPRSFTSPPQPGEIRTRVRSLDPRDRRDPRRDRGDSARPMPRSMGVGSRLRRLADRGENFLEQQADELRALRRAPVLRKLGDSGVGRGEHNACILHASARHVLAELVRRARGIENGLHAEALLHGADGWEHEADIGGHARHE